MIKLQDPTLLKVQSLINGQWRSANHQATMPVIDPATQEVLAHVADLEEEVVHEAIGAAEQALKTWRNKTAQERSQLLDRWHDLIIDNREDLAAIMTAEQGKPLAESRGEISYAASFIAWFAEEAKRTYGDIIPSPNAGQKLLVVKQPVGICAAITPWNFPAAMITRKAAPALAAGCVMIVKPAQQTPLTALALGELAQRAGIPAGVLQIVTGDAKSVGQVLTASDSVRKLSFTGSTAIGKVLMAQCADTVKRLSLELGGNAPFIVFEDADIDAAVDGAIKSKFRNAGQTCVCTNRFLIHSKVYDVFAEKFAEQVAKLRIGQGDKADTDVGPLIDEKAVLKVEEHVSDALAQGARVILGGRRAVDDGYYFEPTVILDMTPSMKIAKEETFGPVAALFRFDSEEQAIAMANDTEFGLAAYFYTQNLQRMWRVSEALEYGMVGHNTGLISNEVAPFGGIKQSGIGREGSKYGIEEYLESKYICSAP